MTRFWIILIAMTLTVAASAQTVTKLYVPAGVGSDAGRATTLVYGMETARLITELQPTYDAGLAVANADSSEVWIFGATGTDCDIFSVTTDKLLRTIDVRCHVVDAAFSPDGKFCVVVGAIPGRTGNALVVIDRASSSVALTITEITDPAAVVVTPDSKSLYCVSPSLGTVTKIGIPDFKPAQSLFVGFEPSSLTLSADGRFLFVVCRGLDSGKRGGSQITVIDTRTDKPFWVFDVGGGCLSVALNPDMTLMVVTYGSVPEGVSENVRLFKLRVDDDSISIARSTSYALGQAPQRGAIVSSGRYWIAGDPTAGGIIALDLSADTVVATHAVLGHPHALGISAVTVRVDAAIASIKAAMATESDSALIADYYLDLAYLLKTANRKNDMVAAYQKVINDFPTSFAAISSGLQLADICFADQLYGQAADYSYSAMDNYQRYLATNESEQRQPENRLLTAIDRLAVFSKQFDKEYTKKLAESYLKLTVQSPELAETFFRLGYHLRRANEGKTANRCFAEVAHQLADISDPATTQPLSARLSLATGDISSQYKVKEKKKEPTVDGDLGDWLKDKPLTFSGASGYVYGAMPWQSISDLSGSVYLACSESELYIAGTITDDSLVSIDEANGDMVAIFFDFRPNAGSYFTREFEAGSGCFSLYVIAPTAANPKVRLQLGIQTPYEIASVRATTGYTFELRLPLSTFSGWLTKETKRFGLGVELIDYDNPVDSKSSKAIGFLIPSEGVGGPPRPELYGIAEF